MPFRGFTVGPSVLSAFKLDSDAGASLQPSMELVTSCKLRMDVIPEVHSQYNP